MSYLLIKTVKLNNYKTNKFSALLQIQIISNTFVQSRMYILYFKILKNTKIIHVQNEHVDNFIGIFFLQFSCVFLYA